MAAFSRVASGSILPSRFVAQAGGTGNDFYVRAVTSTNDIPVAISTESTYRDPGVAAFYGAASFPAGVDGLSLRVYASGGDPDTCLLEAGGTVNPGDYIKTDNVGRGVTATPATDNIYARALTGGTTGSLIRVNIVDRPA